MRKYPHTITWWGQTGAYTETGDVSLNTPENQVKARWEEVAERFIDNRGEESVSKAVVYLESQDVAVDDWLYNGQSSAADPKGVSGAQKVRGWSKVSSVDGSRYERKAYM